MTRQEAIAMIEDDKKRHHDELSGRYRAALTMAIEALEQQTAKCDNCKYSEETDGMNCYECVKGISDNFEALEQEQSEIIRCKNCRHDNNCEIQYSAQAGSKFFCSFAERKEQ